MSDQTIEIVIPTGARVVLRFEEREEQEHAIDPEGHRVDTKDQGALSVNWGSHHTVKSDDATLYGTISMGPGFRPWGTYRLEKSD